MSVCGELWGTLAHFLHEDGDGLRKKLRIQRSASVFASVDGGTWTSFSCLPREARGASDRLSEVRVKGYFRCRKAASFGLRPSGR